MKNVDSSPTIVEEMHQTFNQRRQIITNLLGVPDIARKPAQFSEEFCNSNTERKQSEYESDPLYYELNFYIDLMADDFC